MDAINKNGTKPQKLKFLSGKKIILIFSAVVLTVLYNFFAKAPEKFLVGQTILIKDGYSLSETTDILVKNSIIRSSFLFKTIIFASGNQTHISAGEYYFTEPENVFSVANRMVTGNYGFSAIKITIPEGMSSFDIAKLFGKEFHNFKKEDFIILSKDKEGYLFPDTYFFYENVGAREIIKIMENNFYKKTAELKPVILASGKSFKDLIIMASIIENEARTPEDRELVSGILWERIKIGMPLQVDAPFAYISDKNTHELSLSDLATTSPYNTYKYTGLTPSPISNPGIESIKAAIYPKKSNYLYYLSDKNGKIHYAVTFEEHKKNKTLYLHK